MINIKDYTYGQPTKTLIKTIKILNKRGKCYWEYFDYPEYADLPKNITCRLNTDEVDFIQMHWDKVEQQ